jgi:hypothetical protein
VKQRESVMMLCGDDDIAHPRIPRQRHPLVGVKEKRVERLRQAVIGSVRNAEVGLRPLPDMRHALPRPFPGGQGIKPPMDHQAELRGFKPFSGCQINHPFMGMIKSLLI